MSDVADHQIKVYSMGGRFLRSFGEPGLRPGQFSFVNGLAVGPDGNLYVADSNNRRVQVVDKQGAPVAVLDKTDQPEGMGLPRAVALDRFGRVHVADTFGKAVYVYRDVGVPVVVFGQGPDEQQTLDLPEGIAVSDDTIVVSDGGNRRLVVYSYEQAAKNDALPSERDGRVRDKDAGSARSSSSATCATEDAVSRRPVRSGGQGFAFQQPSRCGAQIARHSEVVLRRAWSSERSRRGGPTPRSGRGSAVGRCSSPSGSSRG